MPAFIMPIDSPEAARSFQSLDQFTRAYIEAMFFTSTGSGDDSDLEDATFSDLAPEAVAVIVADCAKFQAMPDIIPLIDGWESEAGRDLWYTRNGHGTGFWDRPEYYNGGDAARETLTKAAKGFRETDLYRGDDGRAYLS